MGSTSYGWLDTIKSWLFAPCSDNHDPQSELHGPGVCGRSRTDDGSCREEVLNRSGPEKRSHQVYYDQPRPTPPPRAARSRSVSRGRLAKEKTRARKNENDMGWMDRNFRSGRRRTRRPQISTPFNFQHTSTGAVNFMSSGPRSAPLFRPLELSIYDEDNRISPLLPYFIGANPSVTAPPPVQIREDVFDDDDATTLAHSKSYSDLSFHIPRRPVGDGASLMTESNFGDSPPRIPPRAAARTRPRAYTSPSVERIVERIASAMIEREMLDAELESIKERQSICLSRPSTSYDLDEPIPAFPLVPPTAPSFAERLSIDRPRTAPSTQTSFHPPPPPPPPFPPVAPSYTERAQSFDQLSRQPASLTPITPETPAAVRTSAFHSHPPYMSPKIIDNSIDIEMPLAPPLPLILRPPLRKKKSFSRVSDWLFPAGTDKETAPTAQSAAYSHRRNVSIDSVTNTPRALTDRDGFYQTLPPSAVFSGRRTSYDSMSDVTHAQTDSLYSTDEDGHHGAGTMTVATSTQWSPGSTPPEAARRGANKTAHERNLSLSGMSRTGTFGSASQASSPVEEGERMLQVRQVPVQGPRPTSVGVAF